MALTKATFRMTTGASINVLDYIPSAEHAAILDGTTTYDATANVQAAIDAAEGKTLVFPYGVYKCGQLVVSKSMRIEGKLNQLDPTNYSTDRSRIDFTGKVSAGAVAFQVVDGSSIIGFTMSGMAFQGSNTFDCLKLGEGFGAAATDLDIRNMYVYGFRKGIITTHLQSWVMKNVRVQSCVNAIELGAVTTNGLMEQCKFVSCSDVGVSMTNCQGLQFNSCEFANFSGVTPPVTMYQTSATIINPYIENITDDYFCVVGNGTENAGDESRLIITMAYKLGGKKIKYNKNTTVIIEGTPTNGVEVAGFDTNTSPRLLRVDNLQTDVPDTGRILERVDGGIHRAFGSYGSPTLTYAAGRGFITIDNAAAASTGIALHSSNLTAGEIYTLTIALRITAGDTATSVGLRQPSSFKAINIAAAGADAEIRTYSFVAETGGLYLTWTGSIDLFGYMLEVGNPRVNDVSAFLRSSIDGYQGSFTAAPTANTWRRGDIVWDTDPTASNPPGWMCVTAGTPGTWKAMANLAS